MPLLLKTKTIELRFKPSGEPTDPQVLAYFLDFRPDHYKLPVTEDVFNKAVVGKWYVLDVIEQ